MHRTRTHTARRPLLAMLIALVATAPAVGTAQSGYAGVVTLRVTHDDGTVVAAGDLDDGRLDVEILPGLSGFGTAEFVLADGTVLTGDVTFGEGGQVTVFTGGSDGFTGSLEEYLAAHGTDVTVEIDDSIDDDRNAMDDDRDGDDRDDMDDDDRDDDDRDDMDDDRDDDDRDDMDDDRDDDDRDHADDDSDDDSEDDSYDDSDDDGGDDDMDDDMEDDEDDA